MGRADHRILGMSLGTAARFAGLAILVVGCGERPAAQEFGFESTAAPWSAESAAPDSPAGGEPGTEADVAPEAAPAAGENTGPEVSPGRAPEPWSIEAVRSALEREPDVVIGVLEDPSCQMFGSIRDVAVDQQGRVFVLDALDRSVKVFGVDGQCLFEFGREGSGPGEYREAKSLDMSRDGRLRILDSGNGRVEQYDVSGSDVRLLVSVPLPILGIDLCTIRDRLFVAARLSEFLLYEVDVDGRVIHAAGTLEPGQYMPVHGPEMALCREADQTIILASRHSARVRWYVTGGELLQERDLPEFAEARIIERDGRNVGYGPGPDGFEQPASFLPLADGLALLQTGLPRDPSAMVYMHLKTYLLGMDGRSIERLADRMHHVFVAQDSILVAGYHDRVPRIGIWKGGPRP